MDARRIVWTCIVAGLVVLAALGPVVIIRESLAGGDGGGQEPAAEQRAAQATGTRVSMAGLKFTPAELTVPRGTQVLFDNDDTAPHTVTADQGSTDSGTLDPGASFSLVVQEPLAYHCEIHPSMTAKILLTG